MCVACAERAARVVRQRGGARAVAPHAAAAGDGARGPAHPLLGRRVGPLRARHGGAPGRRHRPRPRPQRPLPPLRLPRLLRAPLEPRHQDLRAGDHRAPQEVRREHPRRRLPPPPAVHRQRRRGRTRQGLRLNRFNVFNIVLTRDDARYERVVNSSMYRHSKSIIIYF